MSQFVKTSVLIVLALSVVGFVAGCGSSEGEPPKATAQEPERQKTEAQAGGAAQDTNTADLGQAATK